MSEPFFVSRLGPIDKEGGSFFMYYVLPGREDAWAFPAARDDDAFGLILDTYPADALVCEPNLAEQGALHGVETGPFDAMRGHQLSLMAYSHLGKGPFRGVQHEGLIYHFLQTARQFIVAEPWRKPYASEPIPIRFGGRVSFPTHCVVADHPCLAVGLDPTAQKTPHMDTLDHVGVEIHSAPAFVVDALQRTNGLNTIPVPYIQDGDERVPVGDLQLALLIVTMTAILFHESGTGGGHAEFEHAGIALVADTIR